MTPVQIITINLFIPNRYTHNRRGPITKWIFYYILFFFVCCVCVPLPDRRDFIFFNRLRRDVKKTSRHIICRDTRYYIYYIIHAMIEQSSLDRCIVDDVHNPSQIAADARSHCAGSLYYLLWPAPNDIYNRNNRDNIETTTRVHRTKDKIVVSLWSVSGRP